SLGASVLRELGLKNISLEINSIGCPTCRAKYNEALREYYSAHIDSICDTCKGRLERNPMRLLDCKAECCREIAANAPRMLDYICEECTEHFASVKQYLDSMGIEYTVNPSIVRGLDYYTRTVFEFISGDIGAQAAVGGGGRYDGLFRQMGGPDTPAVGFAMGLERIKMVLEAQEAEFPEDEKSMIYLAPMGQAAVAKCMEICSKLRAEGFSAETDLNGRSVKAQMKYADKMGFNFSCVIGDSEIESGSVKIKNMKTGEQIETTLEDGILNTLYDIGISQTLSNLQDTMDSLESIGELSALLGGEE
ncbi:MAG: histidine--tRNA ligase, partial [Clostridia bacterium]|nr:histidine--tRNA ligase [Clostridia bacterium]